MKIKKMEVSKVLKDMPKMVRRSALLAKDAMKIKKVKSTLAGLSVVSNKIKGLKVSKSVKTRGGCC
jgi:hypothetical protein